jgi:Arc/MetJ family transcription regulator
MATNLKIDEELLSEALSLGGFRTKKDTVNEALRAFIRHQKQLKVLEYEGAFEEFDDYDYKSARKGR